MIIVCSLKKKHFKSFFTSKIVAHVAEKIINKKKQKKKKKLKKRKRKLSNLGQMFTKVLSILCWILIIFTTCFFPVIFLYFSQTPHLFLPLVIF